MIHRRNIGRLLSISLIGLLSQAVFAQDYDRLMKQYGLVDIQTIAPNIKVDLRYASTNNFVGENMYGSLGKAYLEASFAGKIAQVQQALEQEYPGYRLIIYDAARPQSVQRRMYQRVANTPLRIYVAPPERGGRHNYGVAVDLSILDNTCKPLDMGTEFDFFGREAHVGSEDTFIKQGKMKPIVKTNRALLRRLMSEVGLRAYDKEWWHYQERISMPEVRKRYHLLSF